MPIRIFTLLFLTAFCLGELSAQPKRLPPSIRNPSQLDAAEGERVITQFRQFRVNGDFIFEIELMHEPYHGDSFSFAGTLSGYASPDLRTRVDLIARGEGPAALKYIQWSRPSPALWKLEQGDATARNILEEGLFAPLLPELTFSPFDLMMPFLDWAEYAYEGTRRLRGREVHFFLLYPPLDDPVLQAIGGVRVAIDADFNVAVRTETLDSEGNALRRLDVQSVKKIDGEWIIRRLDLVDLKSRDRTRLIVQAAAVKLALEPSLFTPEGLSLSLPPVKLQPL